MRISKYVHSCLLLEEQNTKILIDPGNYTFEGKALNLSSLETLDYLLITHEHPDHLYIPFIKELIHKFPQVNIISNTSVKAILAKEGIDVSTNGTNNIILDSAIHEKPLDLPAPQNISFTLFEKLTHPGDSLHFTKTAPILALPITASWAGTVQCLDTAIKLKPKYVIPIHDWHWTEKARRWYYPKIEKNLKENGIEFKGLEPIGGIEI